MSGGGSVVLGYTANNINNHHYSYGNALLGRSVGSGPVGSGPLGSIAGGSAGRRGSGPVAAPPYNPNALPAAAGVNGRLSAGGTGPTRISAGGYRVSTGGGGNAAGAIGANFPGANRGRCVRVNRGGYLGA